MYPQPIVRHHYNHSWHYLLKSSHFELFRKTLCITLSKLCSLVSITVIMLDTTGQDLCDLFNRRFFCNWAVCTRNQIMFAHFWHIVYYLFRGFFLKVEFLSAFLESGANNFSVKISTGRFENFLSCQLWKI